MLMKSRPAFWRILYRIPLILVHVGIALPLTMLTFIPPGPWIRFNGRALNRHMQCWWSGTTCRIFGLRRRLNGAFSDGPEMIAANHISWLDIQVLHSFSQMGFVAKAEIQRWPLAGWIAGFGETVYHSRGSHDSASMVSAEMSKRLNEGRKVAIFAEGGILPGDGVKRFHARLFAAAIDSGKPVRPVMVRYLHRSRGSAANRQSERLYPEITFLPDESFIDNFFRLLRQPPCIAEVSVLDPIDSVGKQRRDLAKESQQAVEAAFTRLPQS
jgi:1-acyl-sn-glycerol-3-phosphate acyltransferase